MRLVSYYVDQLLSRCCASAVAGVRHADDIRRPVAAAVAGRVHQRRSRPLHRRLLSVPDHPRLQQLNRLIRGLFTADELNRTAVHEL